MNNCLDLKLIMKNFAVLCLLFVSGFTFACPGDNTCTAGNNLPVWAKPVAPWPEVNDIVKQSIQSILSDKNIIRTMDSLKADEDFTLKENITLSEIPAPPFHEEKKARAFLEMMKAAGITNAYIDQEGNAIGVRKGTGNGPLVVLDAHLDTVFPLGTDVKVVKKNGKYYGPGITDDSRGLAVLTSWIRALNKNDVKTVGDLMFVGSVGEEGNGDLRGVKALLRDHKNVDAFIGLEPIPMGAIVLLNTGSVRYEVSFSAQGGHSYTSFGEVPSAIHAMGRAIAKISEIKVPQVPRTTFNVGIVRGGTSVNTISPDAILEIDMRSDGGQELNDLHKKVLDIIGQAVKDENNSVRHGQPFMRIGTNLVKVSFKKIGDRPGGMTPHTSPIIQASLQSLRALGQKELLLAGTSTNAGVPISLGIPTVILPPGGVFEGFHSLDESLDPTDGYKGSQVGLLTALAVAGVQGVSQPLILKKP